MSSTVNNNAMASVESMLQGFMESQQNPSIHSNVTSAAQNTLKDPSRITAAPTRPNNHTVIDISPMLQPNATNTTSSNANQHPSPAATASTNSNVNQNTTPTSRLNDVDRARNKMTTDYFLSADDMIQRTDEIIKVSMNPLTVQKRAKLTQLREGLGTYLGIEDLTAEKKLDITSEDSVKVENAKKEALEATRYREGSISQSQGAIQTTTMQAALVSGMAFSALAALDIQANGINPMNWTQASKAKMVAYAALAIVPSITATGNMERANNVVQAVHSGTSKAIQGTMKAVKYVKETVQAHPNASAALIAALAAGMAFKSRLDSSFTMNLSPNGVTESAKEVIAESAKTFVDGATETVNELGLNLDMIPNDLTSTQETTDRASQPKGTILPYIAELVIRGTQSFFKAVSNPPLDGHIYTV
jgi:hypothetical protein